MKIMLIKSNNISNCTNKENLHKEDMNVNHVVRALKTWIFMNYI